jgi:ABC-type branched-subunit amino acid transport system ATPase component
MLTRLIVRNFKALGDVEIELGQNVVLIGPNNSGKTTALQALSLWQSGLREWLARRSKSEARERPGVTLNRRGLTHTPVRETRYLWRHLKVSQGGREPPNGEGRRFIEVVVEGQDSGGAWRSGFEFHYANPESIYCRPMRDGARGDDALPEVPEPARGVRIAFLPPMSGLASEEPELKPGRLDVLIGEGQTAQVLRNLCLQVLERSAADWDRIAADIERMFAIQLLRPQRDPARGLVDLSYVQDRCELDITSAGRGLQQVLLLLAHLRSNPRSVLLLDEPDAHLEILRQRGIYQVLTDAALASGSQIVAASHSEVILNEAADRDVVIAFIGSRPHRIDDRGTQLLKALDQIGFDQYYLAELRGWVLYLEGPTDLAILRAWAGSLGHPMADLLTEPFVQYVGNQPRRALDHFYGLREAKSDLRSFALFDRREEGRAMPSDFRLPYHCWTRREIENYLASPIVLQRFAEGDEPDDLVGNANRAKRAEAMGVAIRRVEEGFRLTRRDAWSSDAKASEDLLPAIFATYYEVLGVPDRTDKSDFHILASAMYSAEIDSEVVTVLDAMHAALNGTS